jgi:hypothetical protein
MTRGVWVGMSPSYSASWGAANPMTTIGDMIIGGASGIPTSLSAGTVNYVLTSNGTGVAPSWKVAAGGVGSVAWGSVTGTLSSQTDLQAALDLKQARTPAVQTVTSASTVTPTFSNDIVDITALAAACQLLNPTGTAIPNLGMVVRIKDNGTARALTYDTQYRAVGVTLPTTTVISKTVYLAMIWNGNATKFDVVAVGQEA